MAAPLSTPAYCRREAYQAFAIEVPHLETTRGLLRAAVAISRHERPTADWHRTEAALDNLADTVRRRVHSPRIEARLAHLHDVLFDVVGLRGNAEDYYNPANSYLPDVLRTKRGLPISLALVYKCVGEGVGLTVHGINSPGHFLVAVEQASNGNATGVASRLMFVDPFYGGGLLTEADVFDRIAQTTGRPAPHSAQLLGRATGRQWIERMLMNLQAVFASLGRERDLLAMQELQSLLQG